ncbi:MAG: hypothetical protein GEU80_12740 [Dehalococcoidia bacterium]|nr:hypothetical protein [Dehalococcoidia bacterium]
MVRSLYREHGQAAVEFVLLFPFVLILTLLLIELAWVFNAHITVNSSAREAARFAAVANLPSTSAGACDANSIEERAVRASSNRVTCGEVFVKYIDENGDPGFSRGDSVVITISHTHSTMTPLGELMNVVSFGSFPATFTLTACSDARLEGPPANQGLLEETNEDCAT